MTIQKHLRHWGLALLLVSSASASFASTDAFSDAVQAQAEHRYALALDNFLIAAQEGNLEAQRRAGLMLLYGEQVYGLEIKQNRPLAFRLLKQAADNGCELSQHMLKKHSKLASV